MWPPYLSLSYPEKNASCKNNLILPPRPAFSLFADPQNVSFKKRRNKRKKTWALSWQFTVLTLHFKNNNTLCKFQWPPKAISNSPGSAKETIPTLPSLWIHSCPKAKLVGPHLPKDKGSERKQILQHQFLFWKLVLGGIREAWLQLAYTRPRIQHTDILSCTWESYKG